MDAEQVVAKILSDAKDEAAKMRSEAEAQAEEINSAGSRELEAFRRETEVLAKQAAEDRKSRMLANARMSVAKDYLTARHGLLEEVFAKAKERVRQMPEGDYQKLISKLMVKAVETGDEEVVIGKGDSRITEKLVKEVNRQLGPGYRGNLHLSSARADISGGFILRRGKVQVNVSMDVLMKQARESLEREITQILFGD